jgi:hypothetical protein
VQLVIYADTSSSGPQSHTLHRVLAAWGEGTSVSDEGGGLASPGDATWSHSFYDTVEWVTPGGEFAASPSASTPVGDAGSYSWGTTPELVADVQAWLTDPGGNFGWILVGNETTTQTVKRFNSRESPNAIARPRLVVDFSPPTAVAARTWTAIKRLYVGAPHVPKPAALRGSAARGASVEAR